VFTATLLSNRNAVLPSRNAVLPSRNTVLPSRNTVLPSRNTVLPSPGRKGVLVALRAGASLARWDKLKRCLQDSAHSAQGTAPSRGALWARLCKGLLSQHGSTEPRAQASGFREFCKYIFSLPRPAAKVLSRVAMFCRVAAGASGNLPLLSRHRQQARAVRLVFD